MRSITRIVKQFKQNWIKELDDDSIARACRDAGMTWLDSMLNPVVTVQIFLGKKRGQGKERGQGKKRGQERKGGKKRGQERT